MTTPEDSDAFDGNELRNGIHVRLTIRRQVSADRYQTSQAGFHVMTSVLIGTGLGCSREKAKNEDE